MLNYETTRICLFGDGLMCRIGAKPGQAWHQQLLTKAIEDYPKLKYYELGIEEDSSISIYRRIIEEGKRRFPKGTDGRIVIAIGLNDTLLIDNKPRVANKDTLAALTQIFTKLKPHAKFLLIGPPPVFDPNHNQRVKRLNLALADLSQKARVGYISLYDSLIDDVQYKREMNQFDKIHPGPQGHDKIFQLIYNDRLWWFSPR